MNAVCHCTDCKRRTGSAFGWSAYFLDEQVVDRSSDLSEYRVRDEQVRWFCGRCGTTLLWSWSVMPGRLGVAVGAFGDPFFGPPAGEADADQRAPWLSVPDDLRRLR
jgi:hypothetical protein